MWGSWSTSGQQPKLQASRPISSLSEQHWLVSTLPLLRSPFLSDSCTLDRVIIAMAGITPYKINIPNWKLDDLSERLARAKFPEDELEGAGWDYGTPLSEVERLTAYWRDQFSWRKAEERLNRLPHFTTDIQCDGFESLKIHFIHKESDVADAIPLLFVHGCK